MNIIGYEEISKQELIDLYDNFRGALALKREREVYNFVEEYMEREKTRTLLRRIGLTSSPFKTHADVVEYFDILSDNGLAIRKIKEVQEYIMLSNQYGRTDEAVEEIIKEFNKMGYDKAHVNKDIIDTMRQIVWEDVNFDG